MPRSASHRNITGMSALPDPPRPANEDARKTLLGKRFAAALVDGLVCAVIIGTLGFWVHHALGSLGSALYILFKDGFSSGLMNGRSFGKMVFHLRPVRLSGGPMDLKASALRNWTLALPSFFSAIGAGTVFWLFSLIGAVVVIGEIVLVVTQAHGRRFGDQLADTEIRSELEKRG